MFKIIVVENYDEVSREAFKVIKEVIGESETPVLGLATGSSPIGLYKKMQSDHKTGTSYKDVITFNLDEYIGLPKNHEQTYYTFMHENLFDGLDIPEENIHIPVGDSDDVPAECIKYEEAMKNHQIDVQVLGIGGNGHIGFNEPGTSFESVTHIVELKEKTREDNARFFETLADVPTKAITMGISTIMKSKKILMVATGEGKANAIYDMLKGPISTDCPASILQKHNDVVLVLDKAAASKL